MRREIGRWYLCCNWRSRNGIKSSCVVSRMTAVIVSDVIKFDKKFTKVLYYETESFNYDVLSCGRNRHFCGNYDYSLGSKCHNL